MPSIFRLLATGSLALFAATQILAATPPPNAPPPKPQVDANDPVTVKCRDGLAKALQKYGDSHPGAPDKLSKPGDLTYDQATEYMTKLTLAFASIKTPDFRRECEPRLRGGPTLATNYVNAYQKMEERLEWYGQAMEKHCTGWAAHSRSEGKHWLGRYSKMKTEAARIENSKSVVDDLTDVMSSRGDVRVTRACRAFGGSQVGEKLRALAQRCAEEMKEYEAARETCEKVCKPSSKTAQCNVFSN